MVAILGSSVALLVRPPRTSRAQGAYPRLLQDALAPEWRVENLSRPTLDIADVFGMLRSDILPLDPDVVVLHVGVNECCPRFLPRRVWRWAKESPRGRSSRPGPLRQVVIQVEKLLRGTLAQRWAVSWFTAKEFEAVTGRFLDELCKETRARVIVAGTAVRTLRIERMLPSFRPLASRFDGILARLSRQSGAEFLDVGRIVDSDPDHLQPDGIHFSADGHREIALALRQIILSSDQ
ncbi:MAG: SGNH/GDSL hydrolase family protein [Acidobacteria bacterium]|nr:SGNH/GDSL hydrolase family protein [Acidobacteriota bacterium]